jgi:hypothetical protein
MSASLATTNAKLQRFARPRATNAGTTYGIDGSAGNNYGLGKQYVSPRAQKHQAAAASSEPSAWWLAAFILFLVVV